MALQQLAVELATKEASPEMRRAVRELGAAYEHIEPDRRRAIDIYGLADHVRAVDLAVELGWWAGRARLVVSTRGTEPAQQLLLDEAEAWWDAGQPALCALALAGVRNTDSGRIEDLANLLDGDDPRAHAAVAAKRGEGQTGVDAAYSFVMAARFAKRMTANADAARYLHSALVANPNDGVAASHLLQLALASKDPATLRSYLRSRLDGLEQPAWIDGMRASAFAMIDTDRHRGFGLRLLRRALERVYELQIIEIPGHIAMWTVLAAHASADGNRRELLPLAIAALQSTQGEVDRVWLAALITEISLREATSPIVAGAYAEIVAEHAPEHPIIRELVKFVATEEVAADEPASATAVAAATAQMAEATIDDARELPAVVATATDTAVATRSAPVATPKDVETRPYPIVTKLPSSSTTQIIATITHEPSPPQSFESVTSPVPSAVPAASAVPVPIPLPKELSRPVPAPPAKKVKPKTVSIPVITAPSSVAAKPAPLQSVIATPPPLPSVARVIPPPAPRAQARKPTNPQPVLDALRTPDRPAMPPPPAVPEDAVPRSRRIAIPIDVRLVLENGTTVPGHSRDISTSGLFVLAEAWVGIGDELMVELSIPGKEAFTENEFRSRARVARRDGDGVGIELISPDAALLEALASL
ncbi:MAG: PilZ domain-containing protein [Kofleriaceae bacterium]